MDELPLWIPQGEPGLLESLLSEGRKWGLRLCGGNQHLNQLRPSVLHEVLANCGNKIIFRLGLTDAQALAPLIGQRLAGEATRFPNFKAIANITVSDVPADPFVMNTLPLD